jgi:hypothetical protein
MQTRDELLTDAVRDEPTAPAEAILRPLAEVGVALRGPNQAAPERFVIGLTADAAVQWTLEGSRVKWRSLGPGGAEAVVRGLFPDAQATNDDGASPVRLSSEEFAALAAGAVGNEDSSPLPDSLRALGAGRPTTWCAMHMSSRGPDGAPPLWLGFGDDDVIWRFEDSDREALARPMTAEEVGREIRGGLTT